ncbi:Hypothetical predicted protein [Mytilus galloprovincialis]|uniref:C1q domain-containing protein n=1 Tax=Mytilus galloprovincialis TaxID=29158 RepID=A0A8B6GFQ0_MYTGA|nr:Hypothetical predicted protein [Mytilus galloprovincialis]
MWMVLMCVFSVSLARGFLLEPDHTGNPTVKNEYLPLGRYLSEKENLLHHIDQLQRGNEEKLHILTTQFQSRLSAFEGKISENDRKNETLELANIERKLQKLGVNHTLLQQEYKRLRDKYGYLESKINRLQHTTAETSKNVFELHQLKSINQALDFRAIQNKVQSLEQKANLLTNNQNTRSQDFLALYNVTLVTDNLFKKYRNETVEKIFNIESKQNASSFDMRNALSKITTLESKVADNSKKVAVTACVSSEQKFTSGVVRFSTVNFQVGINNIDTFKSNGKFVCKIPGLYYISAHIYTSTTGYGFDVQKNGIVIASSASGSDSSYSTNPISAVVELQPNDTLYVYTHSHVIRERYSCLSIIKVK